MPCWIFESAASGAEVDLSRVTVLGRQHVGACGAANVSREQIGILSALSAGVVVVGRGRNSALFRKAGDLKWTKLGQGMQTTLKAGDQVALGE
eukprot:scaffold1574_cov119-Isochrysis_galbana.AAC.10